MHLEAMTMCKLSRDKDNSKLRGKKHKEITVEERGEYCDAGFVLPDHDFFRFLLMSSHLLLESGYN